jgi:hypothetical protein
MMMMMVVMIIIHSIGKIGKHCRLFQIKVPIKCGVAEVATNSGRLTTKFT